MLRLVNIDLVQHTVDANVRNPLDETTHMHRSDTHEMTYLLMSGYTVELDGHSYQGDVGDVFLYLKGTPHLPLARDLSLRIYCLHWLDDRAEYGPDCRARVHDTRGRMLTLLEWLWERHSSPRKPDRATDRHLLALILAEHERLSLHQDVSFAERVNHYLEHNLHHPLTMGEVAAAMGLSVPHLIRRFREDTGETPGKRLQRLRVSRAVSLLRGSREPLKVIARRVGLASTAHLNLLIKRYTGRNPGEFRTSASRPVA